MTLCLALLLFSDSDGTILVTGAIPLPPAESAALTPGPGKFLVATRDLGDWHFSKTVVYLLMHNQQGTLGLIVNRPGKLSLSTVVEGIDPDNEAALPHRLHYGGPVETRLVTMLIQDARESPMIEPVTGNISFSIYREVMEQLLADNKPVNKVRFYRGHAGWMPGQLEDELQRGDWHLIEADARQIFEPDSRNLWQRLIRKLEPEGLMAGSHSGAAQFQAREAAF